MKHIILSIICILGTFISQCYAKETATVALVHNGAIVKTYTGPSDKNNCLKEALEDAEEGDSIFLGYGVFYLQKIDKSIAIIGMGGYNRFGENTTIQSDEYKLSIQPKENSTISVRLEGIYFGYGNYNISCSIPNGGKIKDLYFKKCVTHGIFLEGVGKYSDTSGELGNVTFESCNNQNHTVIYSAKNITFRNCLITDYIAYSGYNLSVLQNCNIVNLKSQAICVNCIIGQVGEGIEDYLDSGAHLVNCLYHKLENYDPMQNCTLQDCYATEEALVKNVTEYGGGSFVITEDELVKNKYIGTDGTVVGTSGGAQPYSLNMHLPEISINSTKIDNVNKKATINVNVTAY